MEWFALFFIIAIALSNLGRCMLTPEKAQEAALKQAAHWCDPAFACSRLVIVSLYLVIWFILR